MDKTRTNKIMRPTLRRLEDMALSVSYALIISWLHQCKNLRQTDGEEVPLPPSRDAAFSPLEENVIKFIQSFLNQHLIGIVADKARSTYVEAMYTKFREFQRIQGLKELYQIWDGKAGKLRIQKQFNKTTAIDVPLFLASVLDEGVEELKIPVSFVFTDLNPKVMCIVAERAPNLKTLKLNLSRIKRGTSYDDTTPLITALTPLAHLTRLSLYFLTEESRLILQSLGKSCPSLIYLKVSRHGFLLKDMDMKGIVLGELAADVMFDDEEYFLQVPSDCLPPMCFSLRHLHLANVAWENYSDRYFKRYYHPVVFALRHLPNLEKMDGTSTCMAIKVLHDSYNRAEDKKKQQNRFEAQCRKVMDRTNDDQAQEEKEQNHLIYSSPTFSGTLSLVRLDVAPAKNAEILRVVGSMCPKLKEVRFWDCLPRCRQDYYWDDGEVESSPTEVESVLHKWPQLESIALVDVTWEYAQIILKVFGPKLKQLATEGFQKVDLLELVPCSHLQTLRILYPTKLVPISVDQPIVDADSFLPELKNLESEICLGSTWMHIFEQKSGLTRVALNCVHVRTQGSSCTDWRSLPLMWPALEQLHILQCDGMNWSVLSDIVHRLGAIKEISIPERARFKKRKLIPRVLDDFCNRPAPINLRFIGEYHEPCPFLQHLPGMEFNWDSDGPVLDEKDVSIEEEDSFGDEGEREKEARETDEYAVEEEDGTVDDDDGVEVEEDVELNRQCTFSDSDSLESF